MISSYLVFVAIFFSLNNQFAYSYINCKNENGGVVDFFIIKKNGSSGYYYLDNFILNSKFRHVNEDITSHNSILSKIFYPVYKEHSNYEYIQYNDIPPENSVLKPLVEKNPISNNSIAKGALIWDKNLEIGIWFLHQIPKYLKSFSAGSYSFPDGYSNKDFDFMCININEVVFIEIIKHLVISNVKQYINTDDNRVDLGRSNADINPVLELTSELKSLKGREFKIKTKPFFEPPRRFVGFESEKFFKFEKDLSKMNIKKINLEKIAFKTIVTVNGLDYVFKAQKQI